MIPIEIVIVVHVRLDRVQVDVDVLEVLHEVETRRHTLTAWNGVAFMRRSAH